MKSNSGELLYVGSERRDKDFKGRLVEWIEAGTLDNRDVLVRFCQGNSEANSGMISGGAYYYSPDANQDLLGCCDNARTSGEIIRVVRGGTPPKIKFVDGFSCEWEREYDDHSVEIDRMKVGPKKVIETPAGTFRCFEYSFEKSHGPVRTLRTGYFCPEIGHWVKYTHKQFQAGREWSQDYELVSTTVSTKS